MLGLAEIILLFIAAGWALMGVWGYNAGKERSVGPVGGALLGLFLGFIGIIIVYCTAKNSTYQYQYYDYAPPVPQTSPADEIKKLKALLDSGAVTQEEYNIQKAKVLNSQS